MKIRRWPLGAGLGVLVAAVAMAGFGGARPGQQAMFGGVGGAAVAAIGVVAWHVRPRARYEPASSEWPAGAPRWSGARQAALEGVVAEFAGPAATAHAIRCVALVDRLAEQLALRPEESEHLSIAAALHVFPVAFPASEDANPAGCEFEASAIQAATAKLRRLAPEAAVRMAAEVCERWDGRGRPNRLAGEECSLGGRILAAVCRFDHASDEGLEAGLGYLREQSGAAFDPVVVAEVIHVFREPWQLQVAA